MTKARIGLVAILIASSYGLWAVARQPVELTAAPQDTTTAAPAGQRAQGAGQRGRGTGRGAARTRKVVLAWADTRNGQAQHDSVSHALAVIERLGYESGAYDTFIRTDSNIISRSPLKTTGQPASGGPNLNNVDAIFFMGHRDVPLDEAQKGELLSFVRDEGKGFVAAHVGLTAFESWPEFGELLGARFDGHPVVGPGTVVNEDPAFPATKHFPATFDFTDEFYQPKEYPATRSTCCSAWISRTSRRVRTSAGRIATTPWPGRRCTAKGASSTGRFPTPPPHGTSATFSRCTSKRSNGRSGSPMPASNLTP